MLDGVILCIVTIFLKKQQQKLLCHANSSIEMRPWPIFESIAMENKTNELHGKDSITNFERVFYIRIFDERKI